MTILKFATVTTIAFSLLTACSGTDLTSEEMGAESESPLSSSTWRGVLTCGGKNGIGIDVDTNQTRHLQAVIRDPKAVAWLSAHPGGSRTSGVRNAKGEIILDGYAKNDVRTGADLRSFTRSAFSVSDALLPEAYVTREGHGVRVRLVTWASGREVETSNWLFNDCH